MFGGHVQGHAGTAQHQAGAAGLPGYGVGDFHRAFHFRQPAHAQLIGDAFRRLERL